MYKTLERNPSKGNSNFSCCFYINSFLGMQVFMVICRVFNIRMRFYFFILSFLLLYFIYRRRRVLVLRKMSKKKYADKTLFVGLSFFVLYMLPYVLMFCIESYMLSLKK